MAILTEIVPDTDRNFREDTSLNMQLLAGWLVSRSTCQSQVKIAKTNDRKTPNRRRCCQVYYFLDN